MYTDDNGSPLDVSQYNRNLQIGVGYFFDFKKNKETSEQKGG